MSWFSQQWDKLSRAFDDDGGGSSDGTVKDIEVVWGKERIYVSLPLPQQHSQQPQQPPRTQDTGSQPPTLGQLRAQLSHVTSIPPREIKLVYHGLVLKDDTATLRSYNVRSGSKLMLIGTPGGAGMGDRPGDKVSSASGSGGAPGSKGGASGSASRQLTQGEILAEERKRKEADRSEEGVMSRIHDVEEQVKGDIAPKLNDFEKRSGGGDRSTGTSAAETDAASTATPMATSTAQQPQPQPTTGPGASAQAATLSHPPQQSQDASASAAPAPSLLQSHRLINELLSRSLLKLDAIPTVSGETRKRRKEAVRNVQALLDRLDAAWEKVPGEAKRE